MQPQISFILIWSRFYECFMDRKWRMTQNGDEKAKFQFCILTSRFTLTFKFPNGLNISSPLRASLPETFSDNFASIASLPVWKYGTSGSKKGVKVGLEQYGQDKLFKVVLTNIFSLKKNIIVTVMPIFREKKATILDFDARGVWRRCILRKISIKWSIPHYS